MTELPYAVWAVQLYSLGLCPLPCGPNADGKAPAVAGVQNRDVRPSIDEVRTWVRKFPDANIGIIPGLSGVTVIDIDNPELLGQVNTYCGHSALVTQTPSGGFHCWYKKNGETAKNLRAYGLEIDVKAGKQNVIVPASRRLSDGRKYEFFQGSWGDLDKLLTLPEDWFRQLTAGRAPRPAVRQSPNGFPTASIAAELPLHLLPAAYVKMGMRNQWLFNRLLRESQSCGSLDDLVDVASGLNSDLPEPLPEEEAIKIARSAWKIQEEGRNWVGKQARACLSKEELVALSSIEFGADAVNLLALLRASHGARNEPFAICCRRMSESRVIGKWSRQRYERARNTLMEFGLIRRVKEGGKRPRDPHLYVLTANTERAKGKGGRV